LNYRVPITPRELSLWGYGLLFALLINGGCVTHQVACQLDGRACLTHQTLALDAMDAMSEADTLRTEDIFQLIHPLMKGQGYLQMGPMDESLSWMRTPKSHHESSYPSVRIVIPGPESPCFRAALPQWLQWSRELPAQIEAVITLSTSEPMVVDGSETLSLTLACGSLPNQLELTVPSSPQGTVIGPWIEALNEVHHTKQGPVIRYQSPVE